MYFKKICASHDCIVRKSKDIKMEEGRRMLSDTKLTRIGKSRLWSLI
jgi:hypothetical protein